MGNPFWTPYQREKLKFAAAIFAAAILSFVLFLVLQQAFGIGDQTAWYICGALFYSIAVFLNAYIDDGSTLFSHSDNRSKGKLLLVHLGCLCALLLTIQIGKYARPHLPQSLFIPRRKGTSWAEFAAFVVFCVVFFIEEDWLAAKRNRHRNGKRSAA